MHKRGLQTGFIGLSVALSLCVATPGFAQTFNSGSNGSLGAFTPAVNTAVTLPPDGILNYTTVNIPAGVTVTFVPNAANTPVTMLATGDVVIAGVLNLNGVSGMLQDFTPSAPPVNPGGSGGPGGFRGGQSGMKGLTNNAASGGQGPGGGNPGVDGTTVQGGTYGAPATFVSLIPLFGGSGGGGTNGGIGGSPPGPFTGGSGGGGGGAIVLSSTTKITVTGSITANGGGQNFCAPSGIGNGSGGAIRLVAPEVAAPGTIQALGLGACIPSGPGRIRIETVVPGPIAPTNPTASIVNVLGPITANSVPALINLPTLTITSVGGVAPPPTPGGSYTTADVILPGTATNPVPVTLTATNTPVPTSYTVKMIPQFAAPVSTTVNSSGSFAMSTATANVTFPNGRISALQVFAGFTLTAALAPIIDGEPVQQILLAAGFGESSSLTLVTKSGKEIPVSRLSHDDQVKVAAALDELQARTQGSKEAAR
ncbi:MAG TPA: hypothetical protein PKA61_09970 [Nitrospira sp.]|nr:hypothetical protein [Nitrospira sp.]